MDDIISKFNVSNLDVNDVKDQLVSKSMEAWQLDNSYELLTDAIHWPAVVVSETGEEASDTTILTAESDSDSDAELVIVWKKKKKK